MTEESLGRQKRCRILVADDDQAVRYLCAEALKAHEVLQAENGKEALELMARGPVDVLLTDVMMPEMNGLDLLRTVKGKAPTQIVVVMTSFGDRETVLEALKSNADDFIDKPIDMLQVRSVVARALEKKRLREELVLLRKADKFKSDFLGLVSHKLKTPITVISLILPAIEEKAGDQPEGQFAEKLGLIQKQILQLDSLVNGLIRSSEMILQESEAQQESVDLESLVGECVNDAGAEAASRKVEVSCLLPGQLPPLVLDRRKIRFVIQALLDNAVKFNVPGGQVEVTCSARDDAVSVAVRDTGAGIPTGEQAKVFEKFYQIDPDYTGQVPGFGLGLFFARQFVRDHGGTLELKSAPGEGTTVTVTLPRHSDRSPGGVTAP